MKKKCVVIFVFTTQEAKWAVRYKLKHQEKMVKTLAPTIPAQLVLKESGLPPFDYFQKELHSPTDYRERVQKLSTHSAALWSYFTGHFKHDLTLSTVPLLTLLELLLRFEWMVVLAAYQFYRKLEKPWSPALYLIPTTLTVQPIAGTTDNYFAPAAYIGRWFAPASKVRTYKASPETYSWIQRITPLAKLLVNPHAYIVTFLRLVRRLSPTAKELPTPLDVLWYSFGYNLDYYREVFTHLAITQGRPTIVAVTGKQTIEAEWLLLKHRIPFTPLASLITSNHKREALRVAEELTKKLDAIPSNAYRQALPPSLPAILRKLLAYKVEQILKSHGTRFALHTVQAEALIKKCKPKLVITTHDPAPSAIPFVHAAKKHGANTLLLLHGIIDELAIDSYYKSNHIALWGPWMQQLLKDHPFTQPRQKLHTMGFPMLDPLLRRAAKRAPTVGTPFHLMVLLSQYNPDTLIISKFLTELFCELPKASFAVRVTARLHREQSSRGFKELAKTYGIPFAIDYSDALETCIQHAHAVLSMDTTAILWPMILHKPLFYTTPWWGSGLLPIRKYKAAWIPNDPSEFAHMLGQFHKKPALAQSLIPGQTSFIRDYVGVTDGTSSEKLITLIRQLSTSQPSNNKHNVEGVVIEGNMPKEWESSQANF